jgi:heterodisulfide reductase subunit B
LVKAKEAGVDAIALSCPLCEYNLGHRQPAIMAARDDVQHMPVYYFSQLLAIAMGVADAGRFDLNNASARDFAKERFAVA